MKLKYLSIFFAPLLLTECADQYSVSRGLTPSLTPRYISVSPTSLSYSSSQSSRTINVESMETPWRIENSVEWINLSLMNGEFSSSVAVTASTNINGDGARVGVFYVKAGVDDYDYETGVSVSQSAATPHIIVSQSVVSLTGSVSETSIVVSSNCSYQISGAPDWLSVSKDGNNIVLHATANETKQYRTATIVLLKNNTSEKITVSQAPASVSVSTEDVVLGNDGGSSTIEIETESDWTASTTYSWIEISQSSGATGKSTLTISVLPNTSVDERIGYVTISVGGESRLQIPIKQRGIYVEADLSELEFESSIGSKSVSINSNTSWKITSMPSWLTVDKESGTGDSEINVTVTDNPNTTERNGELIISQSELVTKTSINVKQKGKTFDVNSNALLFSDKGESQSVGISTDGFWKASANVDWITCTPQSSTGEATLTISVTENVTEEERSGIVIVEMGDASSTIVVTQKSKYFTIDNSILDFTSKGGVLNVYLTSNAQWTGRIEDGVDWLTLSSTSGSVNDTIKIMASENSSVNDRTANVYFDALGRSTKILIRQKGKYLTVDNTEILFYSKGGESNAITLSTDGEYVVNYSESWLAVKQVGNTFTVVATENNTKSTRTGFITVELLGLSDGVYCLNIDVTQLAVGGTFLRKKFNEDENYDSRTVSASTLTLMGFGADTNYDSKNQSITKMAVVNFSSDADLDKKEETSGGILKAGFSIDSDWNK